MVGWGLGRRWGIGFRRRERVFFCCKRRLGGEDSSINGIE